MRPPLGGEVGQYAVRPPLIKPSGLSGRASGKALSDGWAVNFAVGCTHACPFCYASSIWDRGLGAGRRWGDYLFLPSNLGEAIRLTPWDRWSGEEVLMSSTHDPYLPQLVEGARSILSAALPAGVRFCVQTRSPLAARDIPLMARFREQVRLQVSVATMDSGFARLIEPRVATPEARLRLLERAAEAGIRTGAIVAPVFPPVDERMDWRRDLESIVERLAGIGVDVVYGECLHVRGNNLQLLEERGIVVDRGALHSFDRQAGALFHQLLRRYGLKGAWWYEYG